MRWIVAAALLALMPTAAAARDCPPGAYPWIGSRGAEYCRRDVTGPQPPDSDRGLGVCPPGQRLTTDRWGTRTCRTDHAGSGRS